MKWFGVRKAYFLPLLYLLSQSLDLGAALYEEGRAVLRFREKIAVDPYGALLDCSEGAGDPCAWSEVECSDDGRVVALILTDHLLQATFTPEIGKLIHLKSLRMPEHATSRRLLQENSEHKGNHQGPKSHMNTSPSPSPMAASPSVQLISVPTSSASPASEPTPILNPNVPVSAPSSLLMPVLLQSGKGKHILLIILTIAGGSLFLVVLTAIYFFCCRANKVITVMPWRTGLSGQLQKAFVTGVPSLKRSELESACEDFSNVVGSLSDCVLYKGTLSSGVEIAVISSVVTSAKYWSAYYEAQFRKKISVLSQVNHKNFMNLIGYCEEQEPFTRMMVYEYAPNGTLFEHLHIKEADHLDWATRLRIVMGVAYCLDHLHKLNPPVILQNLSSSTIYLSEDYAAKISDLTFLNEEKEAEHSLETSGVLDVQLSTEEGNVYKFGIILLEIISGRLPFSEDDGLLVLWASSHLSGKRPLKDMADTTLESFSLEDISGLCKIIKQCINPDPNKRPKMCDIVAQLRQIIAMPPDAATPKLSPLWWAELEIISTEGNSLQ